MNGPLFMAAASAVVAATAAAAQAPSAPAPAARWHLDGSTNRCVLTRPLDGTPATATFIMRTIPGSGRYEVILGGAALPAELRRNRPRIRMTLEPSGKAVAGRAAGIDLPGALDEGVVLGPLPADLIEGFGRASHLVVSDEQGRQIGRWSIPASARATEALSWCEAEKLVEWGADPAGFEPGAVRPRAPENAHRWLSSRDIVGLALSPTAFTAVFRLVVGPNGRATDCALLESAANFELDRACRILLGRARYEPARDAAGNPIRSVAILLISEDMMVEFIPI